MADKKMLWGILGAALISGMILLACPNDTTEDDTTEDTWSALTSIDQLDGTWKGTYRETKTMGEFSPELENLIGVAPGGIDLTIDSDMTVTVDAKDQKTSTSTTITTITFSGKDLTAETWGLLRLLLSGEGRVIDDDKHSTTVTKVEFEPLNEEEILAEVLQINQDGTKIRMPADSENDRPEMTLTRQ
ncbi:MAG: hypothetical protein LBG14_03895 [Treponema sp.]|jgi:hypothetical protein|nr:hypothetical protein [Treponema sp.]